MTSQWQGFIVGLVLFTGVGQLWSLWNRYRRWKCEQDMFGYLKKGSKP